MSHWSMEGQGAAGGAGGGALLGATIGSVIPGVGTLIGAAVGAGLGSIGGAVAGKQEQMALDKMTKPSLSAPTTPAANQVSASTTAIQSQLHAEQNSRSTGTILTAPGGLTDEPTTTSSLLTGA